MARDRASPNLSEELPLVEPIENGLQHPEATSS
jgi:hypothetical protein